MNRSACFLLTTLLWPAIMRGAAVQNPTKPLPHPHLLFSRADLPVIQKRIATGGWAQARFATLLQQTRQWLETEIKLPAKGGQWYHYYSCPKHGARLQTKGPTQHVCPVDQEVLTGYPYDEVVITSEHNRLAGALRSLGLVYQFTGERPYALKAKEILLAYAAKYESYPLHNIRGEAKVGGGKVGPQTLDESTWLITMVEGADCIWDTLSAAEQKQVKEGLLYPATSVIRQHKMGIHNIQCWKNSAVGLTGLLLGDGALVDEALKADSGFYNQLAKGLTPDGSWYEGAWGYHFYTVSALIHFTEAAYHSGINLYDQKLKSLFDAPLALAMPDLRLPAFNDSTTVSVPGQAALYEVAYARFKDDRYPRVLAQTKRDSDLALLHGVLDPGPTPTWTAQSRNFPASGYAILSAGQGKDATWLCLDYGPHGGGHGHPDKLGFVLYGLGQIIAPDPGTANYGVPIQAGWFRTTLAHNTLTVDEKSQNAAEGKCEAFVAEKDFSAVMAEAGPIYEGVAFRRTVALIGEKLLLFIDQVSATKEHVLDLAYHNLGQAMPPGEAQPFDLPQKPGYSYLRDALTLNTARGLQRPFALSGGQKVLWSMAGGQPSDYIIATGVGVHTEDRVPVVIARRRAKEAAYLWCVALDGAAEPQIVPMPVKLADGRIAPGQGIAAARVTTAAGIHVLVANPKGDKFSLEGQELNAKILHLTPDENGKLQLRHAAM
ncbi:MAG: alginate lyase family protein [Chloroflexi bacterium]|nr:alginate lyase family protein [Chloroflexota bacterium]